MEQEICKLLGWSPDQYSQNMYYCGLTYLSHYSAPAGVKDILERSGGFWGWWKLSYRQRDGIFIEQAGNLNRHQLRWYYKQVHDGADLAGDIYPNAWITMPAYKAYSASFLNRNKQLHDEKAKGLRIAQNSG